MTPGTTDPLTCRLASVDNSSRLFSVPSFLDLRRCHAWALHFAFLNRRSLVLRSQLCPQLKLVTLVQLSILIIGQRAAYACAQCRSSARPKSENNERMSKCACAMTHMRRDRRLLITPLTGPKLGSVDWKVPSTGAMRLARGHVRISTGQLSQRWCTCVSLRRTRT